MMRLLLLLLALASPAFAQSAADHVREADQHYDTGDFGASADAYDQAIAAGAKNPTTFYNAACSAALAGRADDAFVHLDGSLERGFHDVALLENDSDLASLHEDERWPAVVERCQKAEAAFLKSIGNLELRAELLERFRIDQAARRGQDIPELVGRTTGDVDEENTARMKEVVAELGWPGKTLVGEDGARSAWLLVQHADRDPEFQSACLELMKAMPEGEVSAVDVAYLTDRVLVNEGQLQVYGTQSHTVDGQTKPRPMVSTFNPPSLR